MDIGGVWNTTYKGGIDMLNKEECIKALETLSSPPYESSCGGCICGVSDCGDCPNNKANKLLNQLIREHFDKNTLVKCEKCGKEMSYVLVNKFNYSGSDSFLKYSYNRIGDCISIVADRNWTGYELSEEEMLETIVCPHCGKYPFQSKEIHVYDEVEIVMFPKENKNVD